MRAPRDVLQTTSDVFLRLLKARTGFSVPRRHVIVAGDLAYDCELFAVHTGVPSVYPGFPGAPVAGYQAATGGFTALSMAVNVSLLRDVLKIDDAGRIPIAEDLTKASLSSADDSLALSEAFYEAYNTNLLAPCCDNIALAGVAFSGPQGGILETRLTFSIQL